MGSSAMGASLLRRRVQEAGFGEVRVVNKSIASLADEYDLVVSHQDLTERARQRTPSALHVSVEDFMGSPRYDEIVELLHERIGAGDAGVAGSADPEPTGGDAVLTPGTIVLDGQARSREEAIAEAGELLVACGAVEGAYVDAMLERERSVSTAMGRRLAIPHGTNEAKASVRRTAISFVRYESSLDWGGKEVRFVVGIAGTGDEHLALLARVARVFGGDERIAQLERAATPEEVLRVLGQLQPA